MGAAVTGGRSSKQVARLLGATALACIAALAAGNLPAGAQADLVSGSDLPEDAQMLLEADTLVYDNDRGTVTAVGGVRIDYGGNRLVADRVTYDRNSSRLIASGNVEIVEKDGNRIFADQIDITDDFADGFVNALRVETVDKTYFAAESAERESGRVTTFHSGVYTACEPCEDKPEKPPIWRIKSKKIIWNGEEKTVRFENAHFELFGLPIAWLPFFEVADPTVKRKSGFLFPGIRQSSELGYGLRVPYYFALSPTYDLTVAVTGYTKQGFLGEAEWRQQFNNGFYNLKVAGISQRDPGAWRNNRVNGTVTDRGMIGSTGYFEINRNWVFGWDVLAQSDKNFARTYDIAGYKELTFRSEVYLTGLSDRNYFDLRAMHFDIQEDVLDSSSRARDDSQPWVLPSFDYSYTPDEPVAGGELSFDMNVQGIHRSDPMFGTTLAGLEGSSGRLTSEAEWKRSFVSNSGLVLTPLLQARGDAIYSDLSASSVSAINGFDPAAADVQSSYYRYMATAGLEARWPILMSAPGSTHILEPVAQLFVRPDAPYQGSVGIPNEDAQSLVFDATSLFERDKFSGYDRIEGGTRANVGLRYSGSFDNGWTANAIFGQSYQLAGDNPFAEPDLVHAGAYSGLETDVSDFVGLVGVESPNGISASVGARLDEQTFEMRRADVRTGYRTPNFSTLLQYAFIQRQPLYGFDEDRHEVTGRTSVRFHENWSTFASATYDLESETLVKNAIGFAYDDECFTYAMTYSRSQNRTTDEVDHTIGFNISLRTIGDFGSSTNEFQNE